MHKKSFFERGFTPFFLDLISLSPQVSSNPTTQPPPLCLFDEIGSDLIGAKSNGWIGLGPPSSLHVLLPTDPTSFPCNLTLLPTVLRFDPIRSRRALNLSPPPAQKKRKRSSFRTTIPAPKLSSKILSNFMVENYRRKLPSTFTVEPHHRKMFPTIPPKNPPKILAIFLLSFSKEKSVKGRSSRGTAIRASPPNLPLKRFPSNSPSNIASDFPTNVTTASVGSSLQKSSWN